MFFTSCSPRSTKSMAMRPRTCSWTLLGDRHAARLGEALDARRDVDAVAEEVVALDHHVAEIDADAELHRLRRPAALPLASAMARCSSAAHSTALTALPNSTSSPSPISLKMRPLMPGDERREHVPAALPHRGERARLVALHQPAVADHIGGEDRGKTALDGGIRHTADRCAFAALRSNRKRDRLDRAGLPAATMPFRRACAWHLCGVRRCGAVSAMPLGLPTFSCSGALMSAHLFAPLALGGLTLSNRIAVAPMCQYSADDGSATDWHLQHWMSLAMSGAGMVTIEATAVERRGRITHGCLGLYSDDNEAAAQTHARCRPACRASRHAVRDPARACRTQGLGPCALGRRQAARPPTRMPGSTVAPSAVPFDEGWHVPHALEASEIARIVEAFAAAARRAERAGFDFVELHGAHGYLAHEFLSPLSNRRGDRYGGSLENRMRLILEIARAVRAALPARMEMGARLSATEWVEGGFSTDEAVEVARALKRVRRRLHLRIVGRQRGQGAGSAGAWLPSRLRRAHPPRGRHSDPRRRTDRLARSRPRPSSPRAGPTWSRWRAPFSPIRAGPGAPPPCSAPILRLRRNISAPRRPCEIGRCRSARGARPPLSPCDKFSETIRNLARGRPGTRCRRAGLGYAGVPPGRER